MQLTFILPNFRIAYRKNTICLGVELLTAKKIWVNKFFWIQTNFRSKNFWVKNILGLKKNLGQKNFFKWFVVKKRIKYIFSPKISNEKCWWKRLNNILILKSQIQKVWAKNVGSTKVFAYNFLSKNIWVSNNCKSKKILGPKKFGSKTFSV